jgi:hypothetical protein
LGILQYIINVLIIRVVDTTGAEMVAELNAMFVSAGEVLPPVSVKNCAAVVFLNGLISKDLFKTSIALSYLPKR